MPEPRDNDRHNQLRMAAEALVEWIHVRRATWSPESLEFPESTEAMEPPRVAVSAKSSETLPADELGEFAEFSEAADGIDARPPSRPPSYTQPVFTPPPVSPPPPAFVEPPPVFVEPPPVRTVPPPPEIPVSAVKPVSGTAFDVAAVFDDEPPVPESTKPAVRARPTAGIRSLAAPLVPMVRRAAPIVAILAVVIGAGWMARPYLGDIKTWLAKLTETAPAPTKPETVTAKPAPVRAAVRMGQLTARSEPAGATVLVDGRERGVTPLTLGDLTIGLHTVVLQSDKGSVRRTVTIAADRAAVVSESIFAGWLTVFAPFDLQITEGTSVVRLDENGRVLLPPGPHDLRLENRDLGYAETRRVEVQPGETTSLSVVVSPSTLTVTASAPAVVLVDGQQVGETPVTNLPIALGTRDIVVKAADGMERQFTKKVTVAPVQIDVDFSKP